jgi:VWFA-related protein
MSQRHLRKLVNSAIAALAVATAGASPQEQQDSRFKAAATAVTVDVVVRDQRGRPVINLERADFQLLEDDVPQQIRDFTVVGGSPEALSTSKAKSANARSAEALPGAAQAAATTAAPTLVALVFDRLSPEARALAHKGALAYLDTNRAQDFAGVFISDLSLVTLQAFTTDRALVKKAIDEAATRVTGGFDRLRIAPRGFGDPDPGVPPTASAESEGRANPTNPNNTNTVDPGGTPMRRVSNMADRMERQFEAMARDQQGHATINALMAVISGLGELPGRKTVIFFAEALAIPPNVQTQFDSVVATANRLNVSVYSVDAAGLRVHSGQSETSRRVNATGSEALHRNPEQPEGKLLDALELNEDNLRRDPAVSLRLLADRTGGFLINNTNDLAAGFRQIDDDRRFHYLLTYTPANTDFRGEWRRITVKVPGRNVTVRARSGYLAVRSSGVLPLLTYEGPALSALERTPLPTQVPVRASAFVFPQPGAADARVAVLVGTDGGALAESAGKTPAANQTDFTILARLKDTTGEVVRKGSHRYRLSADLRGDVLFFRQPTLPPGSYTLEYVVHDALGQRAGAGAAPVTVPDKRSGQPQVSSLMIVTRTERVPAAERDATNPLYYGDVLLYPSLGAPISKRQTPALTFAFNLIGASDLTRAALTLAQGDRALGETALQLGTPDGQGRIWHVSQLPIGTLSPGEYALAVTVSAGNNTETRRTSFHIIE